jgi:hypothetical protein
MPRDNIPLRVRTPFSHCEKMERYLNNELVLLEHTTPSMKINDMVISNESLYLFNIRSSHQRNNPIGRLVHSLTFSCVVMRKGDFSGGFCIPSQETICKIFDYCFRYGGRFNDVQQFPESLQRAMGTEEQLKLLFYDLFGKENYHSENLLNGNMSVIKKLKNNTCGLVTYCPEFNDVGAVMIKILPSWTDMDEEIKRAKRYYIYDKKTLYCKVRPYL